MGRPNAAGVHPVVIVGAGPVGLTLALTLVKAGIACILLEDDNQVCSGSRALGMSRRTLEIWDALGAAQRIKAHGLDWSSGRSFYRGQTILDFQMPDDQALRHRPMFNIQQCHTESYLLEAALAHDLAEVRWQSRFLGLAQQEDEVAVQVQTPRGEYRLKAQYVVACDGARSSVRSNMGLRLEGTSYEASYVIADIRLDSQAPMERRCWFDPPSNPGLTILMHGQPDKLWRLDYQLGEGENVDEAVRPEKVIPRIQAHLDYIGETGKWTLEWLSPYRVHSRALERFRHGRVLFAGDAAHLMPIFGIRGLNSGVEDAWNLGWKLAQVLQGASPSLLDAYDLERRAVFAENAAMAERNAGFMTPPNAAVRLMRDAVLSLSLDRAPVTDILNPKQAAYVPLRHSPLNLGDCPDFAGGPAPGETIPDLNLMHPGEEGAHHLHAVFDGRFAGMYFSGQSGPAPQVLMQLQNMALSGEILLLVVAADPPRNAVPCIRFLADRDGLLRSRFAANEGAFYLVRPDHHIAARWPAFDASAVHAALHKARGHFPMPVDRPPVHAPLSHAEAVYKSLGNELDKVAPGDQALFLSKLSLLLGIEGGDLQAFERCLATARSKLGNRAESYRA